LTILPLRRDTSTGHKATHGIAPNAKTYQSGLASRGEKELFRDRIESYDRARFRVLGNNGAQALNRLRGIELLWCISQFYVCHVRLNQRRAHRFQFGSNAVLGYWLPYRLRMHRVLVRRDCRLDGLSERVEVHQGLHQSSRITRLGE
jgi:hypothetical protein